MGEPVERVDECISARDALAGGTGVFVAGGPGSGRTHFISCVIDGLGGDVRQRLWIGEDLHRFSHDEAERLSRAVSSGRVVPLATVDTRFPLPQSLDTLWRGGAVVRIDLPAYSVEAVLEIVETFLGGPLDTSAVSAFVPRRSGGDLTLLLDAVDQAKADGVLVESGGRWTVLSSIPPREGLRRRMMARLGDSVPSTPSARLTLDLLGLAPELSYNRVRSLFAVLVESAEQQDDDAAVTASSMTRELERLENDGVIDVLDRGGELVLRLHDPVVERVLPQTTGLLRRHRIATAIVDVLGDVPFGESSSSELIALARHSLVLGRVIDPAPLAWAARNALQSSRVDLALQLALVAVEHGGGVDAQQALAAAESQIGRYREALDRLAAIRPAVADDPDRLRAVDDLISAVSAQAGAPSFRWTNPGPGDAANRQEIATGLHLDVSSAVDDEAALLPIMEGERQAQAATQAIMRGRITEGLEHADLGEEALRPVRGDVGLIRLRRAIALSFQGNFPEALLRLRRLRDEAAASGKAVQHTIMSTLLGEMLLLAGRTPEALKELESALRLVERAGMKPAVDSIRAELAMLLAQSGRVQDARAMLALVYHDSESGTHSQGTYHHGLAWIHVAEGDLERAVAEFELSADAQEAIGHDIFSLISLNDAARSGGARRLLSRAESLVSTMDGTVLHLLVRHIGILARLEGAEEIEQTDGRVGDGAASGLAHEFDQIARDYAAAGMSLHAAEAFSIAWTLHTKAGETRAAAASARHSADELTLCGVTRSPLVRTRSHIDLSAREAEIAELAVAGLSNREIAAELVLSVRTVETHLLRVYQKLGVRARSELSVAFHRRPIGDSGGARSQ